MRKELFLRKLADKRALYSTELEYYATVLKSETQDGTALENYKFYEAKLSTLADVKELAEKYL